MLSFWDRVWTAYAMTVRDYFKEQEEHKRKWEEFCRKCEREILSECTNIVCVISDATEKQAGNYVHQDLIEGIVQLPLYGFMQVLSMQREISAEQKRVIDLFFSHFDLPFTMDQFLKEARENQFHRSELLKLVEISKTSAGGFWVQFFKTLYRTDEDTSAISKLIDSFCAITMRFSVLNGESEERLLDVLKAFLVNVHGQSELCREAPNDVIDFYGDITFVEHYEKYKKDTYKVCRMTMDENDEQLNPTEFFRAFTLGIIYQVIKRCTCNRQDKIKIFDDVLSLVYTEANIDGAYIFKYMEDFQGKETTMLAAMMHIFTDLEDGNPAGWLILSRCSGTYNLNTGEEIKAVQEAVNFIIGMENYLVDKYPMSGFGKIAADYSKAILEILNKDIDENVTIVD